MVSISSAVPSALARYAGAVSQLVARLEGEGRSVESATGRFLACCTEERVGAVDGLAARLFIAARGARELDSWAGQVAVAFRRADAGSDGAWDRIALNLLVELSLVEAGMDQAGSLWPLAMPSLLVAHGGDLLAGGATVIGSSIVANARNLAGVPITQGNDRLNLIERSFWDQAFSGKVDPRLLASLAATIDALNLKLNGPYTPGGRAEGLSAPSSTVSGAYAAVSYAADDQVVLERLNGDGAYRVSIAGLDPQKPGAPNNFLAVILTGYAAPEQNHYYRYVRERFLGALEQIPRGSELHMQGHSMGGGMTLLLRDDPLVQQRLRELEISVPTLTLYGAVLPTHARLDAPLPDDSPFAATAVRAYVHESDSLARNVGAGYDDYPAVLMIDAGFVEAPAVAHSGYGEPENYRDLPDSLRALPYQIDLQAYERIAIAPLPCELPPAPLEPPLVVTYA
jgi:hypothetical protein